MTRTEIALALIQKEIKELEKALPYFDLAKAVVQNFDGKIYNVKLERALGEISLHLNDSGIHYFIKDRHISTGEHSCEYISRYDIIISGGRNRGGFVVEKRIVAQTWVQSIDKNKKVLLEYIVQLKDDHKNAVEKVRQYNEHAEAMMNIRNSMSSSAGQYFNNDLRKIW